VPEIEKKKFLHLRARSLVTISTEPSRFTWWYYFCLPKQKSTRVNFCRNISLSLRSI